MELYYSVEKNVQILIVLMKKHGIRQIIASPGSTNICFVASVQSDPYFKVYSCVDERSAAYMACGLAEESGEPVAISCTGATASRNYVSALTEAFYRKLPILAITSTRPIEEIGHHIPQVMDRTSPLNDTVKMSVYLPDVNTKADEWGCIINVNKALCELRHRGGGPVHINLMTRYREDFSVKELPDFRAVHRIEYYERMPKLDEKRIGIYVGAHSRWEDELTTAVDEFCEKYNAVVLCDHTSNYKGKYGVTANLVANQYHISAEIKQFDIMIHIGNISGAYMDIRPSCVWRVNEDGEIRDTFKKLELVFEMRELDFFKYYNGLKCDGVKSVTNYERWEKEYKKIEKKALSALDRLPITNPWIALKTARLLPQNSVLHLAILNSLRSWSFFDIPHTVDGYSNVGGFGIDGCVSSLIGASFANSSKLYFGVVGDLAFFYDMNSIGNRHIGPNVRLMVVNNGLGVEFKLKQTLSIKAGLGDSTDIYVAAGGHFGNKSNDLIKHLAMDLGFQYMKAEDKKEFEDNLNAFVSPHISNKPILFEVFTDQKYEAEAISIMRTLETSPQSNAKNAVKGILGEKNIKVLKRLIKNDRQV